MTLFTCKGLAKRFGSVKTINSPGLAKKSSRKAKEASHCNHKDPLNTEKTDTENTNSSSRNSESYRIVRLKSPVGYYCSDIDMIDFYDIKMENLNHDDAEILELVDRVASTTFHRDVDLVGRMVPSYCGNELTQSKSNLDSLDLALAQPTFSQLSEHISTTDKRFGRYIHYLTHINHTISSLSLGQRSLDTTIAENEMQWRLRHRDDNFLVRKSMTLKCEDELTLDEESTLGALSNNELKCIEKRKCADDLYLERLRRMTNRKICSSEQMLKIKMLLNGKAPVAKARQDVVPRETGISSKHSRGKQNTKRENRVSLDNYIQSNRDYEKYYRMEHFAHGHVPNSVFESFLKNASKRRVEHSQRIYQRNMEEKKLRKKLQRIRERQKKVKSKHCS